MLKLQIVSDLHWEFNNVGPVKSLSANPDVFIMAGDIIPIVANYNLASETFKYLSQKYQHIIYVLGNHDFFGADVNKTAEACENLRKTFPNIYIFDRPGQIKIENQNFICGTMWFQNDPNNIFYERGMPDFHEIKGFKPWVYNQNDDFLDLLNKKLSSDDIVITHHLPSYQCVDQRFKDSQLNRFFVCDIDNYIYEKQYKMHIYGHSHMPMDFYIEKTRIINNAFGYPGLQREFNKEFIVEI